MITEKNNRTIGDRQAAKIEKAKARLNNRFCLFLHSWLGCFVGGF
jgi:hypothetical protein